MSSPEPFDDPVSNDFKILMIRIKTSNFVAESFGKVKLLARAQISKVSQHIFSLTQHASQESNCNAAAPPNWKELNETEELSLGRMSRLEL